MAERELIMVKYDALFALMKRIENKEDLSLQEHFLIHDSIAYAINHNAQEEGVYSRMTKELIKATYTTE